MPDLEDNKKDRQIFKKAPRFASLGLVLFIVAVLAIAVFFFFYRFSAVQSGWSKFLTVMQPILIGFAIAFVVNPIERNVEKYYIKKNLGKKKEDKIKKRGRTLGVAAAIAVFLAAVVALILLIIPQTVTSVRELIVVIPDQLEAFQQWLTETAQNNSKLAMLLDKLNIDIANEDSFIIRWIVDEMLPKSSTWIEYLTTGVISVGRTVLNFIIGIIIAIYVLTSKDLLKATTKKIIYTIFGSKRGNWVARCFRKSEIIFGGFVIGKIIDSIIIGIICFVVMLILRLPYSGLISIIVGFTNVIPFFGPFIGAIPSILLILLVNPWQALYFMILILILQQFDGNILGPKILGGITGLNTFWVLFAILVFGGFFGIPGMVLGVPVFGVIYYILQEIMAHYLKKRNLPIELSDYKDIESIDPETGEVKYHTPKNMQTEDKKDNKKIFKKPIK